MDILSKGINGIYLTHPSKNLSSGSPTYPQVTFNKLLEGHRTILLLHLSYG